MSNDNTVSLINCPFCGSNKVKITTISKGASKGSYYQGLCNKCWSRGPKTSDKDEAALLWNKRCHDIFVPEHHVDKNQLSKFLNNEILLRCNTVEEYCILLNDCKDIIPNIEDVNKWKYTWFNYNKDTVAHAKSSIVDKDILWFGYSSLVYFKSELPSISIVDIKII